MKGQIEPESQEELTLALRLVSEQISLLQKAKEYLLAANAYPNIKWPEKQTIPADSQVKGA